MTDISVTFIIPCYNELPEVLYKTIQDLKTSVHGKIAAFEIIVVDDGSGKHEYQIQDEENITLLRHNKNKGYGAALKTGIKNANYDWIGITDADGTYPNDKFEELFKQTHDCDMVVGARSWNDISTIRKFPKKILTYLASFLADYPIPDLNSGMRLFKKEMSLLFWNLYPSGFSFTSTITMACITNEFEVKYVNINYFKRIGKSSINPIKDTIRFFNLVTRLAMYFNPKKFFMPISFILFILAIGRGIRDYSLNGFLGGLSMILFFMAFQVFFFGLLAEIINKTRKFLSYGNNKRA